MILFWANKDWGTSTDILGEPLTRLLDKLEGSYSCLYSVTELNYPLLHFNVSRLGWRLLPCRLFTVCEVVQSHISHLVSNFSRQVFLSNLSHILVLTVRSDFLIVKNRNLFVWREPSKNFAFFLILYLFTLNWNFFAGLVRNYGLLWLSPFLWIFCFLYVSSTVSILPFKEHNLDCSIANKHLISGKC